MAQERAFDAFTQQELETLQPYCTNPGSQVFVVDLPGHLTGATYARYSRARGSWGKTFLREFVGPNGKLNIDRANDLIRKVLVSYGDDSVGELENAAVSFENVSNVAVKAIEDRLQQLREAYIGERKNRRDRPGRALEYGYPYTFDLIGDLGAYRDMHRMRMMQQLRQPFTTRLGFIEIPEEIVAINAQDVFHRVFDQSHELYEKIRQIHGQELAQYAVVFGANTRYMMCMNEREAMHTLEIRTVPQGHPSYRRLAQRMHKAIEEARPPWHARALQFVDHKEYSWARAASEARQRAKEAALEDRGKP